jgi:DNA-binding response OmpR family regulator
LSAPARILVAESDEIVLALITHILNREGYSVDVAVTADQARLCLLQSFYSAVVMDSAIISAVDGHGSRTILLSRHATSDLPVHTVIQKPVEFGLLIDSVRRIVG